MSRIGGLRLAVAAVVTAAAVAGVVSFVGGAAGATGSKPSRSQTVEYTLPVPALALDNLCNLDAVVLNGDLHIRTTTTTLPNGGVTVTSTINGRDLTGFGLPSALNYVGENREYSYSYTAPPPGIGTFQVTQYTKLVPQGNAPTMYLVVVLREVVLADLITVPVIDRMYLVCKQPTCGHKKV